MLDNIRTREQNRLLLAQSEAHEKSNASMSAMNQKLLTTEKIETRNKIDIFEDAFRKIKEATGVSDVNEVIRKIVSQKSTTESLIELTRENSSKIEAINERRKKLKASVEEMKYSGVLGDLFIYLLIECCCCRGFYFYCFYFCISMAFICIYTICILYCVYI